MKAYTKTEDRTILTSRLTDVEIANKLGRPSAGAIRQRRYALTSNVKTNQK